MLRGYARQRRNTIIYLKQTLINIMIDILECQFQSLIFQAQVILGASNICQMQIQNGELQSKFNIFLQCSQQKPDQAKNFNQFQYMEGSLKKSFKLLKKREKVKISQHFIDFWKQLSHQQQISYYIKSVQLLRMAVRQQKPPLPAEKESDIYIKKGLIGKWQKKNVRLTAKSFFIRGNKQIKSYDLYKFALRKSKNKQYFGWVLQSVQKSQLKSLHCGVANVKDFQDWYKQFDININYIRVDRYGKNLNCKQEQSEKGDKGETVKTQYLESVEQNLKFNQSIASNMFSKKKEEQENADKSQVVSESSDEPRTYRDNRTATEIVINNQVSHVEQMLQIKPQRDSQGLQVEQSKSAAYKPNIFKRLMPDYNLNNFTEVPPNASVIQSNQDFRIIQIPTGDQKDSRVKMSIIIPFPKSFVFKAIAQETQAWNSQIQTFNIKTSVRSENTAIIYEKYRSQGLLYRQRDYLFLRHCFCIQEAQKLSKDSKRSSTQFIHKTFIIDKSIDSVHNPPFMTVARGQKQLIWCLVKGQTDKECLLVVQGIIKGGGYMNKNQNKDMTVKFFKQILKIIPYLKQKTFAKNQDSEVNGFFKQNWLVTFNQSLQQEVQVHVRKPKKIKESSSSVEQDKNPVQLQQERNQQEKQLKELMQKQQEHVYSDERKQIMSSNDILQQNYRPPPFNKDGSIKVPQKYLGVRHSIIPKEKSEKPTYFPDHRGHHLWKGQWQVNNNGGGLNYVDEEKMQEQKKVLTFIIKRIGRNILTGKGILNVSLPVDIFCVQSNIERLAMSFGFFPDRMEKAAKIQSDQEQMKQVICSGLASSLIYITMEKPFNPILGETYQCWMDGCPLYFQQISHHPPTASFLMKGRGYQISGGVEAKMDISINSGTGYNEGIFKIKFDSGNIFYFITPKGQLQGLTYGSRRLNLVGKTYYWSNTGLFIEITYNPFGQKKGFFGGGGGSYSGQEKFTDYFQGQLKRYEVKAFKQFLTPKKNDIRQQMIIPKGPPPFEPKNQLYKVEGRCFKYIKIDGNIQYDADKDRFYGITDEKNPLPSHANFRQDVVYRRLKEFVKSQEWKQKLQILQRKDRKGRQQFEKKLKKK